MNFLLISSLIVAYLAGELFLNSGEGNKANFTYIKATDNGLLKLLAALNLYILPLIILIQNLQWWLAIIIHLLCVFILSQFVASMLFRGLSQGIIVLLNVIAFVFALIILFI